MLRVGAGAVACAVPCHALYVMRWNWNTQRMVNKTQTTWMDDEMTNIHIIIYTQQEHTTHAVKQATRQKWDKDDEFSKINSTGFMTDKQVSNMRTGWQLEARSTQLWFWVIWKSLNCLLCSSTLLLMLIYINKASSDELHLPAKRIEAIVCY